MTLPRMLSCLLLAFALGGLCAAPASSQPAAASSTNAAETFVAENIGQGLAILNDRALSPAEKASRFETFLTGITDLRRIALFALGAAANSATPAEKDAFAAAFRTYASAVYRSYFERYNGQALRVTGSRSNGPGDTIVQTVLTDPSGAPPLQVDFRVRSEGPKPVVIDIGVAGIWLAITQRADFAAFLSQNGNRVSALTASLNTRAQNYR